jgi:hypothetical protein
MRARSVSPVMIPVTTVNDGDRGRPHPMEGTTKHARVGRFRPGKRAAVAAGAAAPE